MVMLLELESDVLARMLSFADAYTLAAAAAVCQPLRDATTAAVVCKQQRGLVLPSPSWIDEPVLRRLRFAEAAARQFHTIATSAYHTVCIEPTTGTVLTCGHSGNARGLQEFEWVVHLGHGTWAGPRVLIPRQVVGLDTVRVVEVAATYSCTLLRTMAGEVWTVGKGACLGHGEHVDVQPRADSDPSFFMPRRIASLESVRIVQISGHGQHALALSHAGELYSWGRSNGQGATGHGQWEGVEWTPRKVMAVADPMNHVSAGDFNLMVGSAGALWAWGFGANGELAQGPNDLHCRAIPVRVAALAHTRIVHASAGVCHGLAVDELGRAYVWGGGRRMGEEVHAVPRMIVGCSRIVRVGTSLFGGLLLSLDGKVTMCDDHGEELERLQGIPRVREIATKFDHHVLRTEAGLLLAFGDGRMGQLGTGRAVSAHTPTPMAIKACGQGAHGQCWLLGLPRETLRGCCLLLDAIALCRLASVSKACVRLGHDELVWRSICLRTWPQPTRLLTDEGLVRQYRTLYEQQSRGNIARPCRRRNHLDWRELLFTLQVFDWHGTLRYSQTVPFSEMPPEAMVVVRPPERALIGSRAEVAAQRSLFQRLRIRWSVVRRHDAKVAVLFDEAPDDYSACLACTTVGDAGNDLETGCTMPLPRPHYGNVSLPSACLQGCVELCVDTGLHLDCDTESIFLRLASIRFDLWGGGFLEDHVPITDDRHRHASTRDPSGCESKQSQYNFLLDGLLAQSWE